MESKNSETIAQKIVERLKGSGYPIQTITFDNDKAFSCHEQIATENRANSYFTRPYTGQDKGTVENRIGVIRRFFPKKTDLTFVCDKRVKEVETLINERPIRKFKYLNANQVPLQKIALIT